MLAQRVLVFRQITPGQDAPKNLRVEGLDPAVHHFWKTRVLSHLDHLDPLIEKEFTSPTGTVDFHAAGLQSSGKFSQSGFVADADDGTADRWGSVHG